MSFVISSRPLWFLLLAQKQVLNLKVHLNLDIIVADLFHGLCSQGDGNIGCSFTVSVKNNL